MWNKRRLSHWQQQKNQRRCSRDAPLCCGSTVRRWGTIRSSLDEMQSLLMGPNKGSIQQFSLCWALFAVLSLVHFKSCAIFKGTSYAGCVGLHSPLEPSSLIGWGRPEPQSGPLNIYEDITRQNQLTKNMLKHNQIFRGGNLYGWCVSATCLTQGPWKGPLGIVTSWVDGKTDARSIAGFCLGLCEKNYTSFKI